MADWRSASADMRSLGIDEYLAALNVLVDGLGGRVDLVGLCQGGWLSLVYAARFPAKVRKLVMAGAPVDLAAQQSGLSAVAEATPLRVFQSLVSSGNGLVIGRNIAKFWGNQTDAKDIRETLQTIHPIGSAEFTRLETIFKTWNSWTMTFPANTISKSSRKLQAQRTRPRKLRRARAKDRPLAAAASDLSSCRERRRRGRPATIACRAAAGRNRARGALPPGRAVQSPEPVHGKTDA
jgi:pimeloyl-ACP methyl ester carboxylesterase